jgi:pimeloyl-ACP methyl ester carboxylesterase
MPQEIDIDLPHVRLAALVWGPETAPPVMALHGWLDNAASFQPLASHLKGVRLVALDLPGHGLSGHRGPGLFYHFVDYVWDVLSAATALGWDRFSLLGHSLGAGVASFASAIAPDRVERLGLIEGLGPLAGSAEDGPAAHTRALQQMHTLGSRSPARYSSLEEAAQARASVGDLSSESTRVLARRGLWESESGFSWRSDPRLRFKSTHYYTEEQVVAYLCRIRAPVCLVLAKEGYLRQRPQMRNRYASVGDMRIVEIPGGHHLHMDDPVPVAAALNPFFS